MATNPEREASATRPTPAPILILGTPKNYSVIRESFWSRPEKKAAKPLFSSSVAVNKEPGVSSG